MEEKRTNEPSKVGTFLSSAANRVLNLLMILVIIALAALVAWFWHENELLQNDIKNLNEKVEDFEKMSSMDKSRDVVVREEVEENNSKTNEDKIYNSEMSETKNESVVSSNLVTYKNDTFKYVVSYPSTWKVTSSHLAEEGSEAGKDMNVEFYKNDVLVLNVYSVAKAKVGELELSKRAFQNSPYPMDKTTISGVSEYKIGNLNGYRRSVSISDPVRQGLEYIAESDEFIYYISTRTTVENDEIKEFVKSFKLF